MKTTFIIPSINRPTLERAIKSVERINQPYLVYHDDERAGAGHARQQLIKHVDTDWVSMLDDDDTITEDYVQRLEEEIAAHPDADLIHFRQYFINTGQVFPNWPEVAWGNIGISFSVKTKVARQVGYKSEPYEDFEFVKRVKEAGFNVYFSKYLVYRVRH